MPIHKYSSPAEIKSAFPTEEPVTSMLTFLMTFYPHEINTYGMDETELEKTINTLITTSMETL